jgi:hypothetical protein
MPREFRIPSYRLHRPSSRAVVTLDGRDHYLGSHGSAGSKAEYRRLVGEWLARRQMSPSPPRDAPDEATVAEVMLAYPPDLSEDATQLVLRQAELSTANGD